MAGGWGEGAVPYSHDARGPPPWATARSGGERGAARRKVGTVLLFVAFIASAIAAATPWWYDSVTATPAYSSSSAGSSGTLAFDPGSTGYVTCSGTAYTGWNPCGTTANNWAYATSGLTDLGGYYVAVHVMTILAAALGLVCAIFMAMAATRRGWGRWHFHLTHLLALTAGILTLLAPALLILVQPGLVGAVSANSATYYYFLGAQQNDCGANTPNSSYWNSCTYTIGSGYYSTSYQASWGAGLGWFASLTAALAFLLGGGLFLSGRHEGSSRQVGREMGGGWGGSGAGYGVGGPPSTGPWGGWGGSAVAPLGSDARELVPALAYQGASVTSNRTSCRACGHLNAPGSVLCTRCHAALAGTS